MFLILRLELRLTVDCPGKIPVVGAVLNGYNTAGRYLAGAWVAFADIHNMPDNLLVGRRYGCAHPVGGIDIAAEDIRIPKLSMLGLSGDGLPHVPRFAAAVVNDRQVRGVSLVAVTGSIGAAALYEDEIILDQVDGLLLTVFYIDDLLCDLLITSVCIMTFFLHPYRTRFARYDSQDILPTAGSCSRIGCIW